MITDTQDIYIYMCNNISAAKNVDHELLTGSYVKPHNYVHSTEKGGVIMKFLFWLGTVFICIEAWHLFLINDLPGI